MQISRMLTFLKFYHKSAVDSSDLKPLVDTLFNMKEYREAVADLCEGHEVLDPFQISIILQVRPTRIAAWTRRHPPHFS